MQSYSKVCPALQCVFVHIAHGLMCSCYLMALTQLCVLLWLTVRPDAPQMSSPYPERKEKEKYGARILYT